MSVGGAASPGSNRLAICERIERGRLEIVGAKNGADMSTMFGAVVNGLRQDCAGRLCPADGPHFRRWIDASLEQVFPLLRQTSRLGSDINQIGSQRPGVGRLTAKVRHIGALGPDEVGEGRADRPVCALRCEPERSELWRMISRTRSI